MKGLDEIIASNKVLITEKSPDGFFGVIFIRGWQGTFAGYSESEDKE